MEKSSSQINCTQSSACKFFTWRNFVSSDFSLQYFIQNFNNRGIRESWWLNCQDSKSEQFIFILVSALFLIALFGKLNYKKAEIESLIFEAAVKDFELKTLKAQLNPHFVFNAMNSIRALIEEDPESAKNAVTKLSNLMRYTLKIERTETVPLTEELRTIQDYLDLEKIRFEERLNYKITSSAEAERVEIPPMMIQTLVENGIKHGISKSTTGGDIEINCSVVSDKLKIVIINTGSFDEEQLKNSKGFGVSNTVQRLNLLYGDESSFSIKNLNHNQVITEIKIPLGGIKHESFNYR
ncbi:MAG: sensor histidine kinase [Ignavibacterium sp.]|uniref:sensor histidine kinase n=1 Tax=Ignavibacterium sp. TaxID=2651167 RepID=UPI004049ADB5